MNAIVKGFCALFLVSLALVLAAVMVRGDVLAYCDFNSGSTSLSIGSELLHVEAYQVGFSTGTLSNRLDAATSAGTAVRLETGGALCLLITNNGLRVTNVVILCAIKREGTASPRVFAVTTQDSDGVRVCDQLSGVHYASTTSWAVLRVTCCDKLRDVREHPIRICIEPHAASGAGTWRVDNLTLTGDRIE